MNATAFLAVLALSLILTGLEIAIRSAVAKHPEPALDPTSLDPRTPPVNNLITQLEGYLSAGLSDPQANALVVKLLSVIEEAALAATPNPILDEVEKLAFDRVSSFVASFAQ